MRGRMVVVYPRYAIGACYARVSLSNQFTPPQSPRVMYALPTLDDYTKAKNSASDKPPASRCPKNHVQCLYPPQLVRGGRTSGRPSYPPQHPIPSPAPVLSTNILAFPLPFLLSPLSSHFSRAAPAYPAPKTHCSHQVPIQAVYSRCMLDHDDPPG